MKHGYIYKISYDGLDYYGSSKDKNRFSGHKSDYKKWKDGKKNYMSSYQLFQEAEKNNELPTFEVIGCFYKYFCNDCIRKEEQKYIDNFECVNKQNAFTDEKEYNKKYYEEHQEEIKEQKKIYNEEHKEEIKVYKKKYREAHKEEIKEQMKVYNKQYYLRKKLEKQSLNQSSQT